MSLAERPRGSARPTPNEHYNSLPRTSIEGALGIRTSGDTRDTMQGAVERAHETANRALAVLPPEVGRRVARGG